MCSSLIGVLKELSSPLYSSKLVYPIRPFSLALASQPEHGEHL